MSKKIKIIVSGLLITLILVASLFYIRATRPLKQAENEAVAFAKKHIALQNVDEFYWFTRKDNNFTIVGDLEGGQEIIAFIPEAGDKIKVLKQSEGIKREQVLALIEKQDDNTIIKYSLGMIDETPTWEIVTRTKANRLNYYLVDFKSGEITSILENV